MRRLPSAGFLGLALMVVSSITAFADGPGGESLPRRG